MKPMLAKDWVREKLLFPVLLQPKIDGVRAINNEGRFTGRSLKPFGNRFITEMFSQEFLHGLDGEVTVGDVTASDVCRKTTSAVSTIDGQPQIMWNLFDYFGGGAEKEKYSFRYEMLKDRVQGIVRQYPGSENFLQVVDSYEINNMRDLDDVVATFLEQGYEGAIIRSPFAPYKYGRSTLKEQGLLRIKLFEDAEAKVIELTEAMSNENEATINALGYIERSSHQANKVPKGMLGNMKCVDLETGEYITVGPGNMTHEERKLYWERQDLLVGKTIKYKFFPKGIKDKPRFPTFLGFRDAADLEAK